MRQESPNQWHFWSSPSAEALKRLDSGSKGISGDEAQRRHLRDAHLLLKPKSRLSTYELLFRQFTSPIILILVAAAGLAALTISVPFQFAADGALSRAVWWHNLRYAR